VAGVGTSGLSKALVGARLHTAVIPAKAGIQYAAAYRFNH
jgi:hypothetical protein